MSCASDSFVLVPVQLSFPFLPFEGFMWIILHASDRHMVYAMGLYIEDELICSTLGASFHICPVT